MFKQVDYSIIDDKKNLIKLELDPVDEDNYPSVSIVTPMYNRYNFIKLMIRNFTSINYPRELLEWIIVDDSSITLDSDDKQNLGELLSFIDKYNNTHGDKVVYKKFPKHIPLGAKRNLLATYARNQYIIHMDDDDFYPTLSVFVRIRALLHYEKKFGYKCLVGCSKVNCLDLLTLQEFESFDEDPETGNELTLSESTLGYSKEYFKNQGYNNNDTITEFLNFAKGRYNTIITIPSSFIITQLTHNMNTVTRRINRNIFTESNFMKNLCALDENIITNIRASILVKDPVYKKILNIIKSNDYYNFFKKYDNPLCNEPDREVILSNPLIMNVRRSLAQKVGINHKKKTICYYCGPGDFFKFSSKWSPNNKTLGGSEESVINLAYKFAENDYNVNIYCVLDKDYEIYEKTQRNKLEQNNKEQNKNLKNQKKGKVYFKQYWEWVPEQYHDITIIWRDPTIIKNNPTINTKTLILDLHDYFTEKESKLFDSINNNVIILSKSEFHKKSLNFLDNKFKINVIPNGINPVDYNPKIKKWNQIINTSSPDRTLLALLKAIPLIKKEIPEVELHWAYGFSAGISSGGLLEDSRKETKQFVSECFKLMETTEGFKNLNRLSQNEIIKLYQTGSIFVYPTYFSEIDCISLTKSISAGCIPIVTNIGAMEEKIKLIGESPINVNNIGNKNTLDKSLDENTEEFDNFVKRVIEELKKLKKYEENEMTKENNERILKNKNEIDIKYNLDNVSKEWIKLF